MADHDEEDLFADLYENEDVAPAAPAAVSAAPVEPEAAPAETTESISAPIESAPVQDSIANGSNHGAAYDHNQQDQSYGNDMNTDQQGYDPSAGQGYDYNDQGNDYNASQQHQQHQHQQSQQQHHEEEDYKPIGIKEDGKMFIGGLNWETTDQSLRDYFSQFGEVVECTVMRDGATGRSRGFGFLTFRDPKTVNIVMVKEHQLDGKIIDPKRAIPRDEQERTSKIFVGGVSQEATEQDFKNFFMQFGRVLDATLMMDKDTGRPRGFGFVTFDSEAAVDRTLERPLEILGKFIEVKKAQPRGNIRDDDDGRGGRFNKHQKNFNNGGGPAQGGGFDNSGGMGGQAGQAMGGNNGMSPAMMAQYWQRMQQYFQVMQQQMAANMGGGGGGMNPMMGGGGQPNPQMMQQMMAMQNNMGRGGQDGMPQGMNPAMMQQMQQMQQMQNNQNPNAGQPQNPQMATSPMNGGPGQRPGYTAQEQMLFEQQKYERQASSVRNGPSSATSWEGMYDDIPAPGGGPSNNAHNNANFNPNGGAGAGGGRGGFGSRGRGGYRGASQGHTPQPQGQAPANAPTGPKNAGKPGANYRGGGRGGHRGFHPYARGGGGGGGQ